MSDRLLAWFDLRRRDLPWRGSDDPYGVLVSEVMLQQTRVTTVVPYYRRFLDRFPTMEALADASDEEVLAEWQGLGYYARARNLRRAAELIARQGLPADLAGLRALPGIGEYSAAALASRLLGLPVACVDGNVERVIARLFGIEGLPERNPARATIRARAATLISPERPGDSNQALMELGSEVCRPGEPLCSVCPLSDICYAHEHRLTDRLPARSPRKKPIRLDHVSAVLHADGSFLIKQIPPGGWWEGLWEFPRVALEKGESVLEAARRAAPFDGVGRSLPTIRHTVTDYDIRLHPLLAGTDGGSEGRWVAWNELAAVAMPAPQRKVADAAVRAIIPSHS